MALPKTFSRDAMASVVVFLVALPLCMGISIASGVPPALGLITGIIGGLVVGFFAGQPLQVSGPAAGLAVLVYQLVQEFGIAGLGVATLIAGIIQLAAGVAGLGRWFRAVSPAVIQGMLAGIGVLIFASQFHVMVDDKPLSSGLDNLLTIPKAIYKGIFPMDGTVHHLAAAIGLLTVISIVVWNRFKPSALKAVPGPLFGIIAAVVATQIFQLPISHVAVPDNLLESFHWVTNSDYQTLLTNKGFWIDTVGIAIIASAETLLCATAVDRMHDGERTKYDKELRAQGIGNMLCGVVGALPMTGVIVRSSANVEAGGTTRWSAILHGVWILVLVAVFPQVLALIPTASLAGILVYTGVKLFNFPAVKELAKKGKAELFIWAATVLMIVGVDLLTGVVVGFVLSLTRILITFAQLDVQISNEGKKYDIMLFGAATFVSLPKLAEALEALPGDSEVHVHLDHLAYVDHACIELLKDWDERHPGTVVLATDQLDQKQKPLIPGDKEERARSRSKKTSPNNDE